MGVINSKIDAWESVLRMFQALVKLSSVRHIGVCASRSCCYSRPRHLGRLSCFGLTLCAIPVVNKDKAGLSLQNNQESLSHRSLIKNAAAVAVDSACILLTHAALAAISLHQEYAQAVDKLKHLLEDHACFVGLPSQEDELWQRIIEQRINIDDKMEEIQDLDNILTSALLVVERAAEAAYQADTQLSAMTAGQHVQLVQSQLDKAKGLSAEAKETLSAMQVQLIQRTGTEG